MICPNCGTQNSDTSTFCPRCGTALANKGDASGRGAEANGSLSFAEGAQRVLGGRGIDMLRDPERFRAFMSDECDHGTREYRVFERNCVPALLDPFANVAASSSGTEELKHAAWMAEQYLDQQKAEDASTAHNVAVGLASAVASVNGLPFSAQQFGTQQPGNAPSTGTLLVGMQPTPAAGTPSPGARGGSAAVATTNVGFGTNTATNPGPYAAPANPQNNKRSLVPLIVAIAVLLAILGGVLAFILLNGNASSSSSSASSSTTSSSSASGSSPAGAPAVVSFDGGSADSGNMEPVEVGDGSSIVVPKCSFTRDGYEFVSWVDDKGNEYNPGDTLKANSSTTLTAKWVSNKSKQDAGSNSNADTSFATNNSSVTVPQNNNTQTAPAANPAASFPRMWSGTYVGTSSYVEGDHHITRAVAFNFTTVDDSGYLEGVCYVGSAETGAGETYGTCYVTGFVHWDNGEISIQGTEWIDQGGLGDLREYGGSVNFPAQTMGGSAWDVGTGLYETPWNVSAVSEINIWQDGNLTTIR